MNRSIEWIRERGHGTKKRRRKLKTRRKRGKRKEAMGTMEGKENKKEDKTKYNLITSAEYKDSRSMILM
jgi:hypothetical protein